VIAGIKTLSPKTVLRSGALPVSISGVSKQYGDTMALQPLDLEVAAGELVSLLGPSGCGKTTTLRIVAGSPDSGTIRFGTQDVTNVQPNRRGLGMVFQSYSLFPHMTVEENVAFGLRMRGVEGAERSRRVAQMLDIVHLASFAKRFPAQMSGGQQQRVALARALVTNPSVLLLDEPLAALDKNLREQMQFEIRDIQRRLGITTLLVTHDQEEALTMSDRVAVMCEGSLLQIGTPGSIYTRPRSRFVSAFLGTSNLFSVMTLGTDDRGRIVVRLDASGLVTSAVPGDPAWTPSPGKACVLAIRPEKLSFRRHEVGESPQGMLATMRQRVFRGSYEVCEFAVEGLKSPVVAYTPESGAGALEGDLVDLAWHEDNAVLLAD